MSAIRPYYHRLGRRQAFFRAPPDRKLIRFSTDLRILPDLPDAFLSWVKGDPANSSYSLGLEGFVLGIVASGKTLDQPPAVFCSDCGAPATIIHSGLPYCGHHALRRLEPGSDVQEPARSASGAERAKV